MSSFTLSRKLKLFLIVMVLLKYSLLAVFFLLQGMAIELAIAKDNIYYNLGGILVFYCLIKIIVMICDISQKFSIEYFKESLIKSQWAKHFPNKIFCDTRHHGGDLYLLFFDYWPKMFELQCAILINYCTVIWVLCLAWGLFFYAKFYYGMIVVLLIFILTYISKMLFVNDIGKSQKAINSHKSSIVLWINQYFDGYREISKNWQNSDLLVWKQDIYNSYYVAKKQYNLFYLYRDLLGQLLVELPFIINSILVILSVYYGLLSITQMFIWIGLAQFMINASNSYFENKINQKQRDTLLIQINAIITNFQISNVVSSNLKKTSSKSVLSQVILSDGSHNTLSLNPGVYHIQGANGSGKSTLLNIILDYERNFKIKNNLNFDNLVDALSMTNIRVIERDAVIFDSLQEFSLQVLGPSNMQHDQCQWFNRVKTNTFMLFSRELAEQWLQIFTDLNYKYNNRANNTLSSGERVTLSFIRFLCGWTSDVKLLIIDECEAFLDQNNKRLFTLSVNQLAMNIAIFISNHERTSKVVSFEGYKEQNIKHENLTN